MSDRKARLGDVVDDYCPRCKLLLNHGVMALAGDEIKKVRCNTCMNEHPYRHGKWPRSKKDPVKQAFEELMGKIPRGSLPASEPPRGRPTPPVRDDEDEPEE